MLSKITADSSSGIIFISPEFVLIKIFPSPTIISSAAMAVGIPHVPEPSPSDIHDSPAVPLDVTPNSTLLADNIPSSTRSVKFESTCWYADRVSKSSAVVV